MAPTPGALIREARKRAGLTQTEMAERCGTTQAAISRLERDRVSPNVATLEQMLRAVGERLELSAIQAPETLLRPDTPTETWDRLDREKREILRPEPDASVADLLRRGMALSRQAARLRRSLVDPEVG